VFEREKKYGRSINFTVTTNRDIENIAETLKKALKKGMLSESGHPYPRRRGV
jgi:hypothetical protein